MPDWVEDRAAFDADRRLHRDILAREARRWAALPPGADPFADLLEAPLVIGVLHTRHAAPGRAPGTDAMLAELVGALWNLDPETTAIVTTAALHRAGPSARIVTAPPRDEDPIACPRCGWTGTVGDTDIEYFSEVSHRECPRCETMLLILAG